MITKRLAVAFILAGNSNALDPVPPAGANAAPEFTLGRHVLIFSHPRHKSSRRDMTIQISLDDGRTLPARHHLLLDQNGGSYPSLVMIDERTLGILHESSQADLVFQKIHLAEMLHEARDSQQI